MTLVAHVIRNEHDSIEFMKWCHIIMLIFEVPLLIVIIGLWVATYLSIRKITYTQETEMEHRMKEKKLFKLFSGFMLIFCTAFIPVIIMQCNFADYFFTHKESEEVVYSWELEITWCISGVTLALSSIANGVMILRMSPAFKLRQGRRVGAWSNLDVGRQRVDTDRLELAVVPSIVTSCN